MTALTIKYGDEEIVSRRIKNIREDYDTGQIYEDGKFNNIVGGSFVNI